MARWGSRLVPQPGRTLLSMGKIKPRVGLRRTVTESEGGRQPRVKGRVNGGVSRKRATTDWQFSRGPLDFSQRQPNDTLHPCWQVWRMLNLELDPLTRAVAAPAGKGVTGAAPRSTKPPIFQPISENGGETCRKEHGPPDQGTTSRLPRAHLAAVRGQPTPKNTVRTWVVILPSRVSVC